MSAPSIYLVYFKLNPNSSQERISQFAENLKLRLSLIVNCYWDFGWSSSDSGSFNYFASSYLPAKKLLAQIEGADDFPRSLLTAEEKVAMQGSPLIDGDCAFIIEVGPDLASRGLDGKFTWLQRSLAYRKSLTP